MAWLEKTPGLYQRPLGENERFIKFIGDRAHAIGREHWSVTARANFGLQTAADDKDHFIRQCYQAWIALRFEHPSIASKAEDSMLTYEVPALGKTAVEVWADETFTVHGPETSADELTASLKPGKYVSAHLLYAEPSIVLHSAHWRTDGYGALHLVNAYLKHLSAIVDGQRNVATELRWGEEVCRLAPSVEEVLGLPADGTPNVCEDAKKYLSTALLSRGAVGLENKSSETLPHGTRSVRYSLTTSETDAVIQACSERNISWQAAVHAACASVTYDGASKDDQEKPYTSTMRFSLRPHLPHPHSSAAGAAGLYTGGYMAQVPASQSWAENALCYNRWYLEGVTPEFLGSRRQYGKEVLQVLHQTPPPPPPASSEIDISSVGDAEQLVSTRYLGPQGVTLEVRDVSVAVETVSRQMYCFVWTFRGRLQLNLVWNEAFYERMRASLLAESLRETILAELGCHPKQ